MPLPPTDFSTSGSPAARPSRALMESPLATNTRVIAHRRRIRERSRPHGRRVLAALGTLMVHAVFLLIFVLGPAYEPPVHVPSEEDYLQVRLIEKPEPPPPPPVRGIPPKVRGPRHCGQTRSAAVVQQQQRTSSPAAAAVPVSPKVSATPPVPAKIPAPSKLQVVRQAPPKAIKSPPAPVPAPAPVAMPPPTVSLPLASINNPQPPTFQPVEARPPQAEGNQPRPPPPSLALKVTAEPALPSIKLSTPAVDRVAPLIVLPALKTPVAAPKPVALPAKVTVAKPMRAPPAPTIEVPAAPLEMPAPTLDVPTEPARPPVVKSVVLTAPANLAPAPSAPAPEKLAPKLSVSPSPPAVPAVPSVPSVAPPDITAATVPQVPAPSITITPPDAADSASTPAQSTKADAANDVSTAPDATPAGRDDAVPGAANSVASPPQAIAEQSSSTLPSITKGHGKAVGEKRTAAGQQTGSTQGARNGTVGDYIQVKPHGDTDIMSHRRPGIEYKPTRFEKDWAPANEDAVTGALRHAVEKTEVKHIFHLPRGIRVECAMNPLVPIALLNCHNPDPPAKPLPQKIYDRLNLPPARPLVKPATAATSPTPAAPPIKLDNTAQCATARFAGGPLPPGCASGAPVKPVLRPASSSSSWAPAADQFHQQFQ